MTCVGVSHNGEQMVFLLFIHFVQDLLGNAVRFALENRQFSPDRANSKANN
jgi:hypothetical protein